MNYRTRISLLCSTVLTFFKASADSRHVQQVFDPVKAVKEIADATKVFADALSKSDSARVAGTYTEGAEILNDGRPTVAGKAAITHFYSNMIGYGIPKFNFTATGAWGSNNDLVIEEGNLIFALTSGKVVVKGRYLLFWKRENGKLKIFRDTFFSDPK